MKCDQIPKYYIRFAETEQEVRTAQKLRNAVFYNGENGIDSDQFDSFCKHVIIKSARSHRLVATLRVRMFEVGEGVDASYSAQFYGLDGPQYASQRSAEIGRFCLAPDADQPTLIRMALAFLTRYVDENEIKLLFGCSSFQGTDAQKHIQAFGLLKEKYLAPAEWAPMMIINDPVDFTKILHSENIDMLEALKSLPPLLRSYLTIGGWVSDHAVSDPKLNTLHVFTGLEVDKISESRKRVLRAIVI